MSAHDIDDAIKEIGVLKASSPTELIINLGITAEENMDFDNITFTDLKLHFLVFWILNHIQDYQIIN